MPKTAILLIDCPDRKGIVVTIVNFLVNRYDVNILNADLARLGAHSRDIK